MYDIKLVLCRKLHLFLGKSTKTAATRAADFYSQYAPNRLSAGASSQTHWGSLQRSPDLVAVFRWPTSKRREGERKRREEEEEMRERGEKEREEEGREGVRQLP